MVFLAPQAPGEIWGTGGRPADVCAVAPSRHPAAARNGNNGQGRLDFSGCHSVAAKTPAKLASAIDQAVVEGSLDQSLEVSGVRNSRKMEQSPQRVKTAFSNSSVSSPSTDRLPAPCWKTGHTEPLPYRVSKLSVSYQIEQNMETAVKMEKSPEQDCISKVASPLSQP
eukprot:gene25145-biopygen17978